MANGQNGNTPAPPDATGWMSDVQRALALIIIGVIAASAAALVMRIVISGLIDDVLDITKTMLAALVNMGLVALGFFFGNTIAKMTQDKGQQALTDKLTSTPPGTLPPVPGGPTTQSPPWWAKLEDAEKNAISAAGETDSRIKSIILAMTAGAATPDDLTYLVTNGLLTQARADTIKAA